MSETSLFKIAQIEAAKIKVFGDESQTYEEYLKERVAQIEAGEATWLSLPRVGRKVAELLSRGRPVAELRVIGNDFYGAEDANLVVLDANRDPVAVDVPLVTAVELVEHQVLAHA